MRREELASSPFTTRQQRIRAVFLERRESYGPRDVEELTGSDPRRIPAAIQDGEIEGELTCSGFLLRWPQFAALALEQWDHAEVEEALGDDAAHVLPPLVRTAPLSLRLPRYQVEALETLARMHGSSIEGLVRNALLTLTEEHLEELSPAIPGIWEAIEFPLGS